MKTILWATLTANGNYAQSSADHPPKPEALADFAAQAKAAGNFIVGRHTFEAMQTGGGVALSGVDIVVVSTTACALPGVKVVRSPNEALRYLQDGGHHRALLAGGAALHNAFLGQGLVDELTFNVVPVLEGKGLSLLLDQAQYAYKDVALLASRSLGGGVTQLHYTVN